MRTVNIVISNCIDCPYSEMTAELKSEFNISRAKKEVNMLSDFNQLISYENRRVLCRRSDYREVGSESKGKLLTSQCHIPDFCPLLKKD